MVSLRWGGLVARAVHLISTRPGIVISGQDSIIAVQALQGWYDAPSGLWATTGWWNSANCLTVLTDWAVAAGYNAQLVDVPGIIANTFNNAQRVSGSAHKRMSSTGLPTSTYSLNTTDATDTSNDKRGFSGFINDYYDDEGWWALALIRSWDVTHQQAYLDMAESIFRDMQAGTDDKCGGGIWWSKEKAYKNAIANELYLSVAASLANRIPAQKAHYTNIARDQWNWFRKSGLINDKHLINDGLVIRADGRCLNNNGQTWSYNQGVILGGLVELAQATGDRSYLSQAIPIALAAIDRLDDNKTGIIREADNCEPNCGSDGSQFKGIFVRNLHYLHKAAPRDEFKNAIKKNAKSIWDKDRNNKNQLGIKWSGPADLGDGPTASTHSSALDVLVAALAIGA